MAKTFDCPHCDASYSALPTLVGRKVRCSSCKNVFQLQHTGIAIKVGTGEAQKPAAGVGAQNKHVLSGKPSAASAAKTRPQTVAIRKQTQRIQKMRTSLQDMADKALKGIDDGPADNALEPKGGAKNKTHSATAKKEINDNHSVVLSSGVRDERRIKRNWLWSIIIIPAGLIVAIFLFSGPGDAISQALSDFIQPVHQDQRAYPHRLPAYRDRLWRNQRQALGDISVIRNINKANKQQATVIEWASIASFLNKNIDTMEEHTSFPIWFNPSDKEKITALWDAFQDKKHIFSFYAHLKIKNIPFIQMSEFSTMMRKEGLPEDIIYALSMVLLPGLKEESKK
ncbi:MAG: hypothetical protein HRU15_10670, partial [Planctomycetes bacterium]|nr:hypothetical protein [Planctomycetota bacterium]